MSPDPWLEARGGWQDDSEGWTACERHLIATGRDEARWEQDGLIGLSRGWAIGTDAWRKALAAEHAEMALSPGLERKEARELREASWPQSFELALAEAGKSPADLETKPLRTTWKVELAERVRNKSGASVVWLA